MMGEGSLGSWSRKTRHYSLHRRNNDDEISEEEGLELSSVRGSHGYRSLETRHYYSSNSGGRGCRSSLTKKASSKNCGWYVDRGGYRSQDTSHYYSHNWGTRVDVQGRGGYRYHTIPYYSHNQGERGRLLTFKEILLVVMGDLDIGSILDTLPPKEDILGVSVQDVELGLKRSTNLPY